MRPLIFVWPHGLVFWVAMIWAYMPEFRILRRAQKDQTASDSKSLQVIMAGGGIAFFIAFPLAWVAEFQFGPLLRTIAFYAGVALVVASSLLRRHCFRMLGASFTGDVRARPDQEVISRGAYRLLRHPSYSAGILMNVGIGLALGSWASLLLLTVAAFAVYLYRISVEERALLGIIGEPYREFVSTRKRLIPYIY